MQGGQLFYQANQALQTGKYNEAQQLYTELLKQSGDNAAVHYNLGIAYYRDGKLGPSIYHFRKAAELSPRDGDIAFNLDFSRKAAKDRIEVKTNPVISWMDNNYPLNVKESGYFFAFTLLLVTVLSIIILFKKSDVWRWTQRVALVVVVLATLGTCHKLGNREAFGVVVAEKANIYSAPGSNNVLLFNLHAGAEFEIRQVEKPWLSIRLADGKKGWVREKDVVY